jgi:hypothetical protein
MPEAPFGSVASMCPPSGSVDWILQMPIASVQRPISAVPLHSAGRGLSDGMPSLALSAHRDASGITAPAAAAVALNAVAVRTNQRSKSKTSSTTRSKLFSSTNA